MEHQSEKKKMSENVLTAKGNEKTAEHDEKTAKNRNLASMAGIFTELS